MAIITATNMAKNPASMQFGKTATKFFGVVFFSLVLVALSAPLLAKDWQVEPSIKVATIYSDNIDLEANAESDLVMEVSPGIILSRDGSRLRVNLDYRLQNLIYADNSDRDSTNHQLSANANSEILTDTLFVDFRSSISQQLSSRKASASSDGIGGAANLSDVTTYSISPFWQQNLGDFADFLLRYTYDNVTSNGSGGSGDDSDSDGIAFNMQNGTATGRINWSINHESQQVRYADGGKNDTQLSTARLGYQLTRTFNTFLSRTEEDNSFSGSRGQFEPEDSTQGAGFTWQPAEDFSFTTLYNKRIDPLPSEDETFMSGDVFWAPTARTDINLSYGSRFFGKTYNANINHRTRWTRWNFSYDEGVSDFRSATLQQGVFVCPAGATALAQCRVLLLGETLRPGEFVPTVGNNLLGGLRTDITDDTFINETGRASVSIVGARNTVTLSLTDTKRKFVADNSTEQDSSVDLAWTHQLAPRTDSRLMLGQTKEQFDDGQEDEFMRYAWRVTQQIASSSIFYVELEMNDRDSPEASRRYDENRLTVSFQKFF